MKNSVIKICVCGAGNAGMAIAADMALAGNQVNLFELPQFENNLIPLRSKGGITLTGKSQCGKTGLGKLEKIVSNPEQAVKGVEVIMVAAPAFGHKAFIDSISPFLEEGQIVFFCTGYFSPLRFRQLKKDRKVILAEANIMPYLSDKIAPESVHIINLKKKMILAAWPTADTDIALQTMKKLYPTYIKAANLLEERFNPGNICIHAPMTIPNAAFFFDRARIYKFYEEVSLCGSKLVEAFDRERIEVANTLDCNVLSEAEYLSQTYQYVAESLSVYEALRKSPHTSMWTTDSFHRGLLEEDLSYFYVVMESLAKILGIKIPITSAIIDILGVFTGVDYRQKGLTLADLGMEGLTTKEQIVQYINEGPKSE